MEKIVAIILLFIVNYECKSFEFEKSHEQYDLKENLEKYNSEKNHEKYNLLLSTEDLWSKNDQINCSGSSGIAAKIMSWFSNFEKPIAGPLEVTLNLYTRKNPKRRAKIEVNENLNLTLTDFNIERKTVFIIHGFLTHGFESWIYEMKDAYLDYEDVNVIVVDWARHSFIWNYYRAIMNALEVGKLVGKFINQVTNSYEEKNKKWGEMHLIGHSLGAHISGIISEEIKRARGEWKVTRITGLDPAQPCFVGTDLTLNKNDAPFVDVIHTNSRPIIPGIALGYVDDMGHVDMYVNGGHHQPICTKPPVMILESLRNIIDSIKSAVCSHMMSIDYFTESLKIASKKLKTKFWGFKWDGTFETARDFIGKSCVGDGCTEMGITADKFKVEGKVFVSTSRNAPYYGPLNQDDIKSVKKQLESDFEE